MGEDDQFPSRPSTRDRDRPWEAANADLPTVPRLAEGLHRQLTDREATEGHYERTANRRVDGVDRYERSAVLVGRVHRSVVELDVGSNGLLVLTHRLVRNDEGLLARLRRGDADARRGIDDATLGLLRREHRALLEKVVDGRVVRYKTTAKLAGFVLGFESATSAPPQQPDERTGVADYLSLPVPELVSRVVAIERRAHHTR